MFAAGSRVVAVATRPAQGLETLTAAEERDLELCGFLFFADPPKANAAASLERLAKLGVTVKVVTGDNGRVAEKVCADLGVASLGTLTGSELEAMSDAQLAEALPRTSIFARVTPEQKSRIIRAAAARCTAMSASSATASTTPSRCTTPMSASPSTPRPTWPRTPPTSC